VFGKFTKLTLKLLKTLSLNMLSIAALIISDIIFAGVFFFSQLAQFLFLVYRC